MCKYRIKISTHYRSNISSDPLYERSRTTFIVARRTFQKDSLHPFIKPGPSLETSKLFIFKVFQIVHFFLILPFSHRLSFHLTYWTVLKVLTTTSFGLFLKYWNPFYMEDRLSLFNLCAINWRKSECHSWRWSESIPTMMEANVIYFQCNAYKHMSTTRKCMRA